MRQRKRLRTRELFAVVTRDRDRIAKLFDVPPEMVASAAECGQRNWRLQERELMSALLDAHEKFVAQQAKRGTQFPQLAGDNH
jgi:hypothetical protein